MRRRGTCAARSQTAIRCGSHAVEGQLLPPELCCILNRAKPCLGLRNVSWCNHGDVRVAREVFSVKGQEVGDAVDLHRDNQPRMVHLHASDRVTDEELSPFLIRGHTIRQEPKVTLDDPCPPFGLREYEAEAAAC
jgi:hypothetical protein